MDAHEKRRFGIILSVLIVAALVPLLYAVLDDHNPLPIAISPDDDGPIAVWRFFLGDARHPAFTDALAHIALSASRESRIQFVYNSPAARESLLRHLRQDGFREEGRLEWRQVDMEVPFWGRDLFIAGQDSEGASVNFLAEPDHFATLTVEAGREGTRLHRVVSGLQGDRTVSTNLRFEGGAVVSDASSIFISPQLVDANLRWGVSPSRPHFLSKLADLFGRGVVLLGSGAHRFPDHVDLYLTPIGDQRLFLADSTLGSRLLRLVSRESAVEFQNHLAGHMAQAAGEAAGEVARRPDFLALIGRQNGTPHRAAGRRSLEGQLTGLSYEVRPLPYLEFRWPAGQGPDGPLVLSYNNVVIEKRNGEAIVYMPVFRLDALDRSAKAAWEGKGFRVIEIDCLGTALYGGGIRCLSQVIRGSLGDGPP